MSFDEGERCVLLGKTPAKDYLGAISYLFTPQGKRIFEKFQYFDIVPIYHGEDLDICLGWSIDEFLKRHNTPEKLGEFLSWHGLRENGAHMEICTSPYHIMEHCPHMYNNDDFNIHESQDDMCELLQAKMYQYRFNIIPSNTIRYALEWREDNNFF